MNVTSQIDRILSARRAAIPRVNQQIEQADSLIECLSRLSALATDLQIVGLPEVFQNAKDLIQEVSSTRSLLGSLKNRFGRDFLTIVTFGLAGTGKSRTLVTLTGLPDTELISRKGDHCTGTIIEVVPNTGAERSYSVKTFSKEDFFQERILPYFSSFGVSTCPRTLDEFIAMKLPDLENAVKFIGKGNAASELQKGRYEQLLQIHSNLPSFQSDLTGESFPIEINEVPAWTTYPHEHEEAADWRCLAVRSMQLKTSIPLEDFQKVRLYDTPGLGSHRVGELDTLSKYIDDQADAVLRIDRPDPLRPRPERFDSELHDDIERQLTSGIKLADILTIVLNRLQEHAPNAEICDVEYQKAMKRGIPSEMIVVADCSQRDELHEEVIHPLLERLVRKCPEIDSRRINMLAGRLDEAAASLRQLLHEVETVVNAQMTQHDGEELFVGWFEKSQESLREELVRLKQEALSQHSEADSEFLEEIKKVTERARQDVLVPGPEEISEFQIRTRGRQLGGTIDHFTEQMRFQIAEICGEIRGELGREVIRSWQNRLRHALSHTGVLELTDTDDPAAVFTELAAVFESAGNCPRITTVCKMIAEFRIDFPHVLYAVWTGLEQLHPNRFLGEISSDFDSSRSVTASTDQCAALHSVLKREKEAAISHIESALNEISAYPSNYCWALIWDINDRLMLSSEVEREWRCFLRRHRDRLMPGRTERDQELFEALTRLSVMCDENRKYGC